ncbi:MAG: EpsG family protein [Paludibacteraceae bacterium]|nr:EpsG family protein [Paludibacteraceae bacterium]
MFYLICFGILCVLAVLNVQMHDKLSTQILNGLAAILLICIAGLRYETGGDWDTYTKLFREFPTFSRLIGRPAEFADISVEEGFVLLCAFVKSLGGTVQHLFFVVTAINITLIASAASKYTKYPVVALLCYYGILYFNLEMIYIRQATAVALCFFALQYIPRKRIIPYMLIVLLACTFHRVAALMLPLYFVLNIKLPSWAYLTVIGLGAVVMLAGIPWIQTIFLTIAGWLGENYADKAEVYTENAMFAVNRGISLGFVLNLALFAVLIFFKDKIDTLPFGTIMLNMFFGSLVLYYYCFELVEVSNRVRLFFLIGIIALLPMVLEVLPLFLERLAGLVVVALYCFSFAHGIFLESPQAAAYNPYQNYIEYKINPRPSTGKQRLEQSKKAFRQERKH